VWLTKLYSKPERIFVLDKEDLRAIDVQDFLYEYDLYNRL